MDLIIYLLTQYKYFILLPLAIAEGPIITVIAGFLCTINFFNPLLAFPIIISGDIIGDSLYYGFGKKGSPKLIKKMGNRIGLGAAKIDKALVFFNSNPWKTISLSKIVLGIGVAGLFLAGQAGVPYKRFLLICLLTSIAQGLFYLCIGLLFGHAYLQINHYLNYFASVSIIATCTVILFFIIKSNLKKI